MYTNCQTCGKEFTERQLWKAKNAKRVIKYCSTECWGKRPRKHLYDDTFLDKDTDFANYFLGLWVTDGHFSKEDKIISITSVDKQIIDAIVQVTKYEKPLRERQKEFGKLQYTIYYSGAVRKRIEETGYTPGAKKAKTFVPARCKEEKQFFAFLRGCIDGDGSILLRKKGNINIQLVSMNQFFLEDVLTLLRLYKVVRAGTVHQTRPNFYKLLFGHSDSMGICEKIYNEATIKLERKYNKYLEGKKFQTRYTIQKGVTCKHPGCTNPARTKDLCKKHFDAEYGKWYDEQHKEQRRESDRRYKEAHREKINEKRRELYAANPEKYIEQTHNWRENNPDKVKEYKQQYREDHKDEINTYKREYREEHKEQVLAWEKRSRENNADTIGDKQSRYKEAHREELAEKARLYRAQNKEKQQKYFKEHYQKNQEKIRERRKQRWREQQEAKNAQQ